MIPGWVTWKNAGYAIVAWLVVIVLVLLVMRGCDSRREAEAQAKARAATAAAGIAAGKAAVETTANNAKKAEASEAQSKESEDVIRKAEGSDREVSPELDSAVRARLCLRQSYRCQPACVKLLGACPK